MSQPVNGGICHNKHLRKYKISFRYLCFRDTRVPVDIDNLLFRQTTAKSGLAIFLPENCCPHCYIQLKCEELSEGIQCLCCHRKVCKACCLKSNLTNNIEMCNACKERNPSDRITNLMADMWKD